MRSSKRTASILFVSNARLATLVGEIMVMSLLEQYRSYIENKPWAKNNGHSPQAEDFERLLSPQSLILDGGCGSGADAAYFRRHGHRVSTIDLEGFGIDIYADLAMLPFRNNVFDAVFSRGVLHQCASPQKALADLRRVTSLGGLIFVSYLLDISADGETMQVCPDLDISQWATDVHSAILFRDDEIHRHQVRTILCRNGTFYEGRRVFLEITSGCNNKECTSPCSALDRRQEDMPPDLCAACIDTLRDIGDVFLYGQGDSSCYPFGAITTNLDGCITNIVSKHVVRTPELKALGLRVFVRCDSLQDLQKTHAWLEADGVFCVPSRALMRDIKAIADLVLSNGVPFAVRSLCNVEADIPCTRSECLSVIGYPAAQEWEGELPKIGCEVTAIRYDQTRGLFEAKPCILHSEKEYVYLPFEGLRAWFCNLNPSGDYCTHCGQNTPNYRLYFEPARFNKLGTIDKGDS